MVLKTVFQDFLILTLSGNPKVLHSGYDISIYCQKNSRQRKQNFKHAVQEDQKLQCGVLFIPRKVSNH